MTTSLCAVLLARADVILRMKSCNLSLDWLQAFSVPQLLSCCDRMDAILPGANILDKTLQRELVLNPAFAAYYAKLLPFFPEAEPVEPEPACNAYGRRNYRPQSFWPKPHSLRSTLMAALYGLIEACRSNGKDITVYTREQVMDILAEKQLDDPARLIFLENFASAELPDDTRRTVIANLCRCIDVPLGLTERQRALLAEPYVTTRQLFLSAPFSEILEQLDNCPEHLEIIRLLHEKLICEELTLENYKTISQDAAECHRLLESLIHLAGHDAVGSFMEHWKRNGCPLYELRTMERRTREHPDANWSKRIAASTGYVNQLYGSRFKSIDLSNVSSYQEDVLIYAIVHNKKHFIRLVDEHAEEFLRLPPISALFQEALYREHLNLNELSASDFAALSCMSQRQLNVKSLIPNRRYTFPELRELCGQPSRYMALYHLLRSDNSDYRLRVFRQIRKRDVLPPDMEDAGIAALAAKLDQKPLDIWMQEDLGHIAGLTAADAAQMLAHLDILSAVLPSIRTRTDALLALRSLDTVGRYKSIADLKENLLHTDPDWKSLAEHMKLMPEFQKQYRESIIKFLCNNGAYIAETYRRGLGEKQQTAFLRVVKAELMGQLDELKYYDGDLQRELDSPLTARVKSSWRRNLSLERGGVEVREHDDFFSTMLLGTQPQRTCLAYTNGAYKECLLSAFDSNKKILYATLNGRIVGRAFLRLTKGRLSDAGTAAIEDDSGFTFVDLEHPASRSEASQESLTLFLERPYISRVGPEVSQNIMRMFTELAGRKAGELDTMLVLSADYRGSAASGFTWTQYAIYISKSKAGAQYLDSLGGQATVNSEGSYKTNNFLVRSYGKSAQTGSIQTQHRRAS